MRIKICLVLFLTTLLGIGCGRDKEKAGIIRVIDTLTDADVHHSPLIDLPSRFALEQSMIQPGKLETLQTAAEGPAKVYAIELRHPVLAPRDTALPPELNLKIGKKKWPHTQASIPEPSHWTLLKRLRILPMNKILYPGDFLETDLLLPKGEVLIRYRMEWPGTARFKPVLEIHMDGRKLATIANESRNELSAFTKSAFRRYTLRLKYVQPADPFKKPSAQMKIQISQLSIECASDILLFTPPPKAKIEPPPPIHISYRRAPAASRPDPDGETNLLSYYKLYHLQHASEYDLNDRGVQKTGLLFKKKLYIKGGAFNAILAATPSDIIWRGRIPDNGILEFGIGCMDGVQSSPDHRITFHISLTSNNKVHDIFERTLLSSQLKKQPQAFLPVKVDISRFEGKEITLKFTTQNADADTRVLDKEERTELSFWTNPIIYKMTANNSDSPLFNIILVVMDTLRADHLGCYGYRKNTSPNLDRFAREGILFENAFSSSSWTLPSHMSLFTSLNTFRHGVFSSHHRLNPSVPTLADLLRENGYLTTAFTGGGYVHSGYGFSKGFDYYQDEGTSGRKSSQELFKAASQFIQSNADKPLFLFLHTYQPHEPYHPPEVTRKMFLKNEHPWKRFNLTKFLRESSRLPTELTPVQLENILALYDGEIRYADEALIGPLIALLKEKKMYRNTLIIITSDHGEEFLDHGGLSHFNTLYNELIHVPLVIKLPGSSAADRERIKTAVSLLDIVPSILKMLDLDPKSIQPDGQAIPSLFSNSIQDQMDRAIYSERYGDFTFRSPIQYANKHLRKVSIIQGPNKFIYNYYPRLDYERTLNKPGPVTSHEFELYDWRRDSRETENLYMRLNRLAKKLFQKVKDYYREKFHLIVKPGQTTIDNAQIERLRALGYIN